MISESKLRKMVRRLIVEADLEDYPEPTTQQPHLGRIAFSPTRREHGAKIPMEPNTDFEDNLESALVGIIMDNSWLLKDQLEAIKRYIRDNHYSDVFSTSEIPILYRGMWMSGDLVQKYLGIPEEDLPGVGEGIRSFKSSKKLRGVNHAHRGTITSWSANEGMAHQFATIGPTMHGMEEEDMQENEDEFGVVLKARTADNPNVFMDLHKLINQMYPDYGYQEEHLALDDVKIFEFDIFKKADSPFWGSEMSKQWGF
jgi:hypothetical protein